LALLALGACLLYVTRARALSTGGAGFPLDDSWIHLQFARSLAEGDGLSFRPGRLVAGSTGPLWTALLSLGFLVPGGALLWAKVFGIALYCAGAWLAWQLARTLGVARPLAVLAAVLVLLTDNLVWSALSGMEIGLFVALSLGGAILHVRERAASVSSVPGPALSLLVFALAALARPEGLLLLGLALADRISARLPGSPLGRRALRGLWLGLGCALCVLLASQLFSAAATGSILPTTYSVKTGGIQGPWPSVRFLRRVLGILFDSQPLAVLLAAGGALTLVERLGGPRDRGLLVALWPFALPVVYSLFDSPQQPMIVGNFGRYYFPLLPFVVILAVLALDRLLQAEMPAGWRRLALITLVALSVIPAARATWVGAHRYAASVRNVNASDVAMARWIAANLPPDALVAAQDIGAVGFFAPNPLLDLAGIVNPEILPWIKGEQAARAGGPMEGLVTFLEATRPPYLMLFRESYPGLVERLDGNVLHRIVVDRNITMAGSELLLVETAWGRGGGQVR
jgi:hypothetical protein